MSEKKKPETQTTKTKAAKKPEPKPKRERKPKEEGLVVFALRMSEAERVALHKSAGPANATRVMRSLAAAFVAEDRAAFEVVVDDAKKLR